MHVNEISNLVLSAEVQLREQSVWCIPQAEAVSISFCVASEIRRRRECTPNSIFERCAWLRSTAQSLSRLANVRLLTRSGEGRH